MRRSHSQSGGFVREQDFEPPPYERLAEAIEAEGWQPGDPIAISGGAHELPALGGIYGLRSPVRVVPAGAPGVVLLHEGAPACERAFHIVPEESGIAVRRPRAAPTSSSALRQAGAILVPRAGD